MQEWLRDKSLSATGLNTYINKVFLFLWWIHLQKFLKTCFHSTCHYGVLCVDWWGKTNNLIHFRIRLKQIKMWKKLSGLNTFRMHCTLKYSSDQQWTGFTGWQKGHKISWITQQTANYIM
jgi:hypothetical protein